MNILIGLEKIVRIVMAGLTSLFKRAWRSFQMRFVKLTFPLFERLGFHLVLNHYYQPIPDTRRLSPSLWEKDSALVGIDMKEKEQLFLLKQFSEKFKGEYSQWPSKPSMTKREFYLDNGYFESVDAEILYCLVRYFKPRNIIEIGSGFSTLVSAEAILKNKEEAPTYECHLTAIEPFPRPFLREGFPQLSRLVEQPVQEIPLSEFERLGENDFLFIDSSHILKIGSDVQYEFLEVLPRLRKGVIVHFHDIFIPREYPQSTILQDHYFFNEQYLLQAFLTYNSHFEVLWGGSFMHLRFPQQLEAAFPSYNRTTRWPGSFWVRKRL